MGNILKLDTGSVGVGEKYRMAAIGNQWVKGIPAYRLGEGFDETQNSTAEANPDLIGSDGWTQHAFDGRLRS